MNPLLPFLHPKLKKFFLVDDTRRTTVKKRWFTNGKKLLQVNKVDNHAIGSDLEKRIIKIIESVIGKIDVVVIMDPQHGLLTEKLIRKVVSLSKEHKKPLYIDSQISHKKSNHRLYQGADTMFLNQKEAKAVYPNFNLKEPEQALSKIRKKLKLKNVVVKLGPRGSIALINDKFIKTPTLKVKTIDVCGAGDAFLAAMSLGNKNRPEESLKIANIWAALSTTIHGTIPPRKKDLIRSLKEFR